jgi:protein gp37
MENSKIAWTTHTYNPWWGCQRVSPGCEHCYAETFSKRLGKALWGPTAERQMAADGYWKQPLAWDRKARDANARHRVFCASMADVFEDRPELAAPRARLFRLIEATPHLDWLLLTKRPQNMVKLAQEAGWSGAWPDNVWAGTTVEDQRRANERIPHLLRVPARVRFLSCEPLLEQIDLSPSGCPGLVGRIDWVIVGGESGPGARPFDLDWARSLRARCKAANVAYFFKQLGSNPVLSPGPLTWPASHPKGDDPDEWPEDLRVQEFPR